MNFYTLYSEYNWDYTLSDIYSKTAFDVEESLAKKGVRNLEDFKSLISPAAEPYLEQMANLSQQMTRLRFGNIVQLYIPLYLSNECSNSCKYCGFNKDNKIERLTLTLDQVLSETNIIKQ